MSPRPVGGGEVRFVEVVLRRVAHLDADDAIIRQQQHDTHLQHQRDLIGRRPQHIIQLRGARQLAAERIKRLGGAHAIQRRDRLRADARGDIRHHKRDQHEKEKRRDVGRIGDGECVDRRQKEEVVAQRRRHACQHRRPQSEARRNRHDGREKNQIDILDAEQWLHTFCDPERDSDAEQRQRKCFDIERRRRIRRPRCLHGRRIGDQRIAGDHLHADIARVAHQIKHDRATQQLEPARPRRFADDDLRDVIAMREGQHIVGNTTARRRDRQHFAAKRFSQT